MTKYATIVAAPHAWRRLGTRRTFGFFFCDKHGRCASWRYFGLELSVEISNGAWTVWLERASAEEQK